MNELDQRVPVLVHLTFIGFGSARSARSRSVGVWISIPCRWWINKNWIWLVYFYYKLEEMLLTMELDWLPDVAHT